ncbi:hypothetical protein PBAL39_14834 [Pedobacter sp. BAL39]|uniref:DUF4832 domain-containing protein n=1 Tax=Pedobacter sp. BAL39 TaxID=391596 RepID=UPI00015597C8|nr:DUF4832 domain-containing protein [Pedobacter sp. BAL39]EDM37710.1 hypothetical protein PBAL39_14834 [Pedobacter sp. BAL39]
MNINLISGCFFLSVVATALFSSCKDDHDDLVQVEKVNVTYTESTEDFPNPERGFYRYSETTASDYSVLDAPTLQSYRTLQDISSATYKVYSTLVFRYYILDNVKTTAISNTFLENIKKDMLAARTAGVKLIPRFVYTATATPGNCPEGFICPTYGDASKAIVLSHIAQLKPVLTENADVIACVQLGFIGTWGENYYSDFFGDASLNGGQNSTLTDQNWRDRVEVLKALLAAMPADRMVQVRYPQFKQRFLYGVNSPLSSSPLAETAAFGLSDDARIGFHNDCFLASANDFGTYEDYGNSTTPRTSDGQVLNTLRDYMKADSRYVVVGGETCSDDYSLNDCEPAGKAQEELAAMHFSYLNAHYNTAVNNDWQSGGCMDNIKKNLGYRFVLQSAVIPDQVVKGTTMNIVLNVKNAGYASPYNKRTAKLILRNTASGAVTAFNLATDVRKWYSGSFKVEESIKIPSDFASGDYEVLLHLPDEYASIAARPEYSIRFANNDVWEATTGYNKLNHTLKMH